MVLVVIAECANHEGAEAWPSVETIAERAGVSLSTVHRCVDRLKELGELEVSYKSARNGCNRYRVRLEALTPSQDATVSDRHSVIDAAGPSQSETETLSRVTPEPSLIVREPSTARAGGGGGLSEESMTAVLATLRRCERFTGNETNIRNQVVLAVESHAAGLAPAERDQLAREAAALAVRWGLKDDWKEDDAGAAFAIACRTVAKRGPDHRDVRERRAKALRDLAGISKLECRDCGTEIPAGKGAFCRSCEDKRFGTEEDAA